MGAHDNDEIIDLTDVIEDPVSSEPAVGSKDLEDEFEQLLQGSGSSQDKGNGTRVDDELDIESLFAEMESSPESSGGTEPMDLDDEGPSTKKSPVHFAEDASIEDMSDIEDIFASMEEDTAQDTSEADKEFEELLLEDESASEESSPGVFLDEDEPAGAESVTEQDAEPEDHQDFPFDAAPDIEPELEPEPEPESEPEPEPEPEPDEAEEPIASQATGPAEPEDEAASAGESTPAVPAQNEETPEPPSAGPGSEIETETTAGSLAASADQDTLRELRERIAVLEARPLEPDRETLFALLDAFFLESDQGANLLDELTQKVSAAVQETARQLVEDKLNALDVPSSEEIAAMVREEISASVAENMPAPPDTQSMVREIREDLQQRVQEGMDAWESERLALRSDIEALQAQPLERQELIQDIREDLQQRVQEGMDAWETQRTALSETVSQLRAALENQPNSRTLVQELGQELRQKIQDHQDAWEAGHQELRTALEALESQQVDRQELVRDIREDLQQRVQEGMDAWEAQRTALDQEIGNLKQTLSDGDARIETLGASVVTRKDLEAIQEKLQAEIAREIPAAAARIIREEIAALTR